MPLKPEEITRRRSPKELKEFVESIRRRAETDKDLRQAGHLRKGYIKEYFDEIIPLANFASKIYPENFTIQPILGNQGYDAEVFDGKGRLFERVEIANPIDGQKISYVGRELAKNSYSKLSFDEPWDDIEDLIPIITHTAINKSNKDYSDSTVVFNVSGYPAFEGCEARYFEQIRRIEEILSSFQFRAKRIFVMFPDASINQINFRGAE